MMLHPDFECLLLSLVERQRQCSYDELRVIDVQLQRLELGRERYGYLDLSKPRDWKLERAEEHVDAAIYDACDTISKRDAEAERLECEDADEFARTNPVEFGLNEFVGNAPKELP